MDVPKRLNPLIELPSSRDAEMLFTDHYQLTMMYSYWKTKKHQDHAVFDVYFRKCPFHGEFAVLAGVNDVIRFINTLQFTEEHITYLKTIMPVEEEFFDYLRTLDGSLLRIYGIKEGSLVFPGIPLLRIEGDLGLCQLVETIVINLVNFPTLVTTNAARHRLAAGWSTQLLEFGARRAQGLDGAMTASRSCYLGGFDATSNLRAGYMFNIPTQGTHSHAFVVSFEGFQDLHVRSLTVESQQIHCDDFVDLVLSYKKALTEAFPKLFPPEGMHKGELAAFTAYAQSLPTGFVALVDTYDTLGSGVPNFIVVALALYALNLKPVGIRLDSGDLVYLSNQARNLFERVGHQFNVPLKEVTILASNAINENVLVALNDQNHKIDVFGIGTHLVTCQSQPALGVVYKLVELNGRPCMKLSQETGKISIPARKHVFRLFSRTGEPIADVIQGATEEPPTAGRKMFWRHLFDPRKRCFIIPHRVEELLCLMWDKGEAPALESLKTCRDRCIRQLKLFRKDILRLTNPAPYKVSCSSEFFEFFSQMWQETAPVSTLD